VTFNPNVAQQTRLKAFDLGLAAVLTKPFDVDDLLRQLSLDVITSKATSRQTESGCLS
jgi:CheY-like chemotaxis protein